MRGPALLARSLLAQLPADRAVLQAAGNAAPSPTVPSAELLPAEPVLQQPLDGLLLARDPRIDDALEAFEFQLAWREPVARVRWQLDGRVVAETATAQVLWPLVAGEHRLLAEATSASGLTRRSAEVRFTVR